ncbi:chorion class CA protein ERA.1-like isoform X4 [Maniola jurtina]|uniref:chorion class CA protein ERA.1-like isoform X4 n=1 Tax=Maniola jurtina TaxID=191418 RepID=UPI001E6886AB|nr:chorion class CA protein ERA.1-like isoform X4 [Maniola jurtina]
MSSFAFLLLCVQACLVQNVFSQCLGAGPLGYGPGIAPGVALAPGLAPYGLAAAPFGVAPMAVELGGLGLGLAPAAIELGAYGGAGIGDVAVAGEMPVVGTTLVAGQVPILGAVRFAGDLPAAGTVTITGSCGCGCNRGPYYY